MARSRSRDNGPAPSAATHKSLYNTSDNANMGANSASPPRRRMTRSQSRDVELNGSENGHQNHDGGDGGGGGGGKRQRRDKESM